MRTTHGRGISYKISAFSDKNAMTYVFRDEEKNTEMNVATYFEQHYQTQLRCPDLPLVLVSKRGRNIALPPEVCIVKPGELIQTCWPRFKAR